jgi:hypothetical protein
MKATLDDATRTVGLNDTLTIDTGWVVGDGFRPTPFAYMRTACGDQADLESERCWRYQIAPATITRIARPDVCAVHTCDDYSLQTCFNPASGQNEQRRDCVGVRATIVVTNIGRGFHNFKMLGYRAITHDAQLSTGQHVVIVP